ncbi:MAG: hypothetical protein QOJ37_998, partial [Pseudonocardiales bacterium]|nr:hypothetical protein [Pseudonocardiales bacterium]
MVTTSTAVANTANEDGVDAAAGRLYA